MCDCKGMDIPKSPVFNHYKKYVGKMYRPMKCDWCKTIEPYWKAMNLKEPVKASGTIKLVLDNDKSTREGKERIF